MIRRCRFWVAVLCLWGQALCAQTCYEPAADEASEVLAEDPSLHDAVVVRACFSGVEARESIPRIVGWTVYTVHQPTADVSRDVSMYRELRCTRSSREPFRCERVGGVAQISSGTVRTNDRVGSREVAEIRDLVTKLRGSRETLYAVYAVEDDLGPWDAPSRFSVVVRKESSIGLEDLFEYALARNCSTAQECAWQLNGPRPYAVPIP